jgi:hypothetical protein
VIVGPTSMVVEMAEQAVGAEEEEAELAAEVMGAVRPAQQPGPWPEAVVAAVVLPRVASAAQRCSPPDCAPTTPREKRVAAPGYGY